MSANDQYDNNSEKDRLFAVLILMNPFATTSVLWTFTGVTLIVEAVIDVLAFITNVLPLKQNK